MMTLSDNKKASLRDIINRLKALAGVSNDIDLSNPLQVSKRNIANWKARDSIPWEQINQFCLKNGYSLEYVVNGNGSIKCDGIAEPGIIYKVNTNQDEVYDIAAKVYTELQAQGKKTDADKFRQLIRLLHRGMIETGNKPAADKIKEMILLI
jgi:hypothetical protein